MKMQYEKSSSSNFSAIRLPNANTNISGNIIMIAIATQKVNKRRSVSIYCLLQVIVAFNGIILLESQSLVDNTSKNPLGLSCIHIGAVPLFLTVIGTFGRKDSDTVVSVGSAGHQRFLSIPIFIIFMFISAMQISSL